MRKTVALPWVALTLASLIAAGCSSNTYNPATAYATPTPFPTPTIACTPPANESVQMVFPQNGSLAAANLQGVVFAVAPNPLPTNWYVYANVAGGPTAGGTTTAGTSSIAFLATPVAAVPSSTPTPLPTPSDMPTFAGTPIYESASIGTFANNTHFQIFLANTNCFPGLPESVFTTTLTDSPSPTPTPT